MATQAAGVGRSVSVASMACCLQALPLPGARVAVCDWPTTVDYPGQEYASSSRPSRTREVARKAPSDNWTSPPSSLNCFYSLACRGRGTTDWELWRMGVNAGWRIAELPSSLSLNSGFSDDKQSLSHPAPRKREKKISPSGLT
jgi:hypothetical protein